MTIRKEIRPLQALLLSAVAVALANCGGGTTVGSNTLPTSPSGNSGTPAPGTWYVECAWCGIHEHAECERKRRSWDSFSRGHRFRSVLRAAEPIPESGSRHDIIVALNHVRAG
jgi:hypothetical protein